MLDDKRQQVCRAEFARLCDLVAKHGDIRSERLLCDTLEANLAYGEPLPFHEHLRVRCVSDDDGFVVETVRDDDAPVNTNWKTARAEDHIDFPVVRERFERDDYAQAAARAFELQQEANRLNVDANRYSQFSHQLERLRRTLGERKQAHNRLVMAKEFPRNPLAHSYGVDLRKDYMEKDSPISVWARALPSEDKEQEWLEACRDGRDFRLYEQSEPVAKRDFEPHPDSWPEILAYVSELEEAQRTRVYELSARHRDICLQQQIAAENIAEERPDLEGSIAVVNDAIERARSDRANA